MQGQSKMYIFNKTESRVIDKPTGDYCVPIISKIAKFFQCNVKYESENEMTFLAQADSKHHLTNFDKYPLMTSKRLDYLCFLQGRIKLFG